MRGKHYRLLLITSAIILFLLAIVAESVYFSDFEYRFRTRMLNRILCEKERVMENCLDKMKPVLAHGEHHGSISETDLFTLAEQNKITILEYIDNKLVYWSDNEFDVPPFLVDTLLNKPLVFLQNGWFLSRSIQAGNEQILGLLRLRTDYGFENGIIKNRFETDFNISENVGFSTEKEASEFHIFDCKGEFLFSLIFPEVRGNTYFILIPCCLWALFFVILMLLSLELVNIIVSIGKSRLAVGLCLLIFSLIYVLVLLSGKPSVIFQTELFSPYKFSLNKFIPSLGRFLLISILGACFSYIFYKYFPLNKLNETKGIRKFLLLSLYLIAGALLICFFHIIFSKLISTSNVKFETFKVLELDLFSVTGFASATLLLFVPLFFLMKIIQTVKLFDRKIILVSILTSLVVPAAIFFNDPATLVPVMLFYIILTGSIWITGIKEYSLFNQTVLFSIIFGFYSLYFITTLSEEKRTENLKIQALSFSTENDPEAEQLLLDLWPVISCDTALNNMMRSKDFERDYDKIWDYLHETYFSGYFGNFNFRIVLCRHDDPLRIDNDKEISKNCFNFFEERIRIDGHKLTGTNFYFIYNQGGRSYYLGKLYYKTEKSSSNGLFIELWGDINVFQPGYSELLLDKKYHGYAGLKDYSFAKYINGELVLSTGDFPYDKTDAEYVGKISDYRLFSTDGYRHVLYKNGKATIIIRSAEHTPGDIIISFASLFA